MIGSSVMLLPDKYASWQRMRWTSYDYRKMVTTVGRKTLQYGSGADKSQDYPYVSGSIHITVDSRNTGWKWSRAALRADPVRNEHLKSRDFGGPFVSNRITYIPPVFKRYESTQRTWSGNPMYLHTQEGPPFPCFTMWNRFQNPLDVRAMPIGMPFDELWALGGRCIASTMPTVPAMNLSVSVAEILREGLPKKLGSSLKKGVSAKGVADEYLNIMFGYVPIISDLVTLRKLLPKMEESLLQLVRDNGRQVRRGVKPRTTTVDESFSHKVAVYGSGDAAPQHNSLRWCNHTKVREVTTWFTASYIYNLPSPVEVKDRFQQMRYVLGLNLDAQTIWNLIPWSWLVDWLMPVEPILQNLSVMARNQVRIQRAYIMCHTKLEETATNGPYSATLRMETKQRDRASPWGFGVKTEALTATQLSILAALGLSRSNI